MEDIKVLFKSQQFLRMLTEQFQENTSVTENIDMDLTLQKIIDSQDYATVLNPILRMTLKVIISKEPKYYKYACNTVGSNCFYLLVIGYIHSSTDNEYIYNIGFSAVMSPQTICNFNMIINMIIIYGMNLTIDCNSNNSIKVCHLEQPIMPSYDTLTLTHQYTINHSTSHEIDVLNHKIVSLCRRSSKVTRLSLLATGIEGRREDHGKKRKRSDETVIDEPPVKISRLSGTTHEEERQYIDFMVMDENLFQFEGELQIRDYWRRSIWHHSIDIDKLFLVPLFIGIFAYINQQKPDFNKLSYSKYQDMMDMFIKVSQERYNQYLMADIDSIFILNSIITYINTMMSEDSTAAIEDNNLSEGGKLLKLGRNEFNSNSMTIQLAFILTKYLAPFLIDKILSIYDKRFNIKFNKDIIFPLTNGVLWFIVKNHYAISKRCTFTNIGFYLKGVDRDIIHYRFCRYNIRGNVDNDAGNRIHSLMPGSLKSANNVLDRYCNEHKGQRFSVYTLDFSSMTSPPKYDAELVYNMLVILNGLIEIIHMINYDIVLNQQTSSSQNSPVLLNKIREVFCIKELDILYIFRGNIYIKYMTQPMLLEKELGDDRNFIEFIKKNHQDIDPEIMLFAKKIWEQFMPLALDKILNECKRYAVPIDESDLRQSLFISEFIQLLGKLKEKCRKRIPSEKEIEISESEKIRNPLSYLERFDESKLDKHFALLKAEIERMKQQSMLMYLPDQDTQKSSTDLEQGTSGVELSTQDVTELAPQTGIAIPKHYYVALGKDRSHEYMRRPLPSEHASLYAEPCSDVNTLPILVPNEVQQVQHDYCAGVDMQCSSATCPLTGVAMQCASFTHLTQGPSGSGLRFSRDM